MMRIRFVQAVLKGTVLDVGCAVGPLHENIARHHPVIGIDINLRRAVPGVVKADATQMPFKNNAFDSVLAGELIEHLDRPGAFLDEVQRVLKKGGLVVLTTPNRQSLLNRLFRLYQKPAHLVLFTREELASLLAVHGFRMERYTFFPYTAESSEGSRHKWFYPVRRVLHYLLPPALQEEMVIVARAL